MKVALLNNQRPETGIGRYASTITRYAANNVDSVDVDHYLIDRERRALVRNPEREREVVHSLGDGPGRRVVESLDDRLTALLLDVLLGRKVPAGYDVVHITSQNLSLLAYAFDGATLLTVHDVMYLTNAGSVTKRLLGRFIYAGIPTADRLVAISEWTKRDILDRFGGVGERVHTIHHGVDDSFRPTPVEPATYDRYDLDEGANYVLHVGRPSERKNFETVLRTAHHLVETFGYQDFGVIKVNEMREENRRLAARLGLLDRVRVFDRVPEPDLIQLYNLADAFMLPSLYEGFGFPVLEAMACGTPVLTSNRTSIPELAGDAGVVLDPTDAREYAEHVFRVFTDDRYAADLRRRGRERARQFTWESCARATVEAYETLLR